MTANLKDLKVGSMNSNEVGIEDARKRLGDYVTAAMISGTTTIITRNGRPAAQIAPLALDLGGRHGWVAEEDAREERSRELRRHVWGELPLRGGARRRDDSDDIATFRRRNSAEVVIDADDLSGVWTEMTSAERDELIRQYEAAVTAALPDGVVLDGSIVVGPADIPAAARPTIVHSAVDSIDVRAMIRRIIGHTS